MARIIKLPSGISIDLEKGEINSPIGSGPVTTRRNARRYSHSSFQRSSLWSRFNCFIENIGEWLRDNTEAISNNIAIGVFFLACIVAIIGAIVVWIDEGFWSFVGYAIIGYLVMYYGGLLITGIMMYALRIPIFILGLVFHNAYVLLITIAISLGVLFYNVNDWSVRPKESRVVNTTTNIPTTTRYKCTANTFLNVRKAPNSSSQIIGTIQRNAIVDVYDISNGFARIKYNNQDAYISEKYIVKIY